MTPDVSEQLRPTSAFFYAASRKWQDWGETVPALMRECIDGTLYKRRQDQLAVILKGLYVIPSYSPIYSKLKCCKMNHAASSTKIQGVLGISIPML